MIVMRASVRESGFFMLAGMVHSVHASTGDGVDSLPWCTLPGREADCGR